MAQPQGAHNADAGANNDDGNNNNNNNNNHDDDNGRGAVRQLFDDIGDLVDDVVRLYTDRRQAAEDVVTVVALGDIAQRTARRAYLWAAAPMVRLEQRLAAVEAATSRVDARLSNPGPSRSLEMPRRNVRSRPTIDRRLQVDVEGGVPQGSGLLFVQDGSERPGRVTQSGAGFLRGDVELTDLRPGRVAVFLEHDGGREPLTTLDVGAN